MNRDNVITKQDHLAGIDAIDLLSKAANLRVWSVIVTIFGDLALAPQDVITSAQLMAITGKMGLKPQAVRVALHRLRNDGWLDSLKTGRTSAHRLSARGFAETMHARARIYAMDAAETPTEPRAFRLAIAPPGRGGESAAPSATVLAPGVLLLDAGCNAPPKDYLLIEGDIAAPPDWLRQKIGPPALAQEFETLRAHLAALSVALARSPVTAPCDVACLRSLIVHHWRRLLLRCPDLPERFYPPDWPGIAARAEVAGLLHRLVRPRLGDI